ncbi:hypothetical protein HYX09_01470 [Candidatus Woesearchaeota archaeon]|nr:hypothetical protein [Candidatus Woesearchaeota archaeon]
MELLQQELITFTDYTLKRKSSKIEEIYYYSSTNKGVTMKVIQINKDIIGDVIDIKRLGNQTLFTLRVDKDHIKDISTNPKDFLNPLVRR